MVISPNEKESHDERDDFNNNTQNTPPRIKSRAETSNAVLNEGEALTKWMCAFWNSYSLYW